MKNTIIHPTRGRLVCKIWDNGAATVDRYTIAIKAVKHDGNLYWPYLSANASPYHPQGFGQYGESDRPMGGRHLGKRIAFNDLPEHAKRFVMDNI